MAAPRLLEAIATASSVELAAARDVAFVLDTRLQVILPMIQLGFGPAFAGLGVLGDAAGDPRWWP